MYHIYIWFGYGYNIYMMVIYIYNPIFIHSSADGHLDCFLVLVIVDSAVMNFGMHVSFWIIVSSRYMHWLRDGQTLQQAEYIVKDPIFICVIGRTVPLVHQFADIFLSGLLYILKSYWGPQKAFVYVSYIHQNVSH